MGWRFDEYAPVGVDLGGAAAVAAYDRNQGTDPEGDSALLDRLGVGPRTTYVDFACGTPARPAPPNSRRTTRDAPARGVLHVSLDPRGHAAPRRLLVEASKATDPIYAQYRCRRT